MSTQRAEASSTTSSSVYPQDTLETIFIEALKGNSLIPALAERIKKLSLPFADHRECYLKATLTSFGPWKNLAQKTASQQPDQRKRTFQKKIDADCEKIETLVPELKDDELYKVQKRTKRSIDFLFLKIKLPKEISPPIQEFIATKPQEEHLVTLRSLLRDCQPGDERTELIRQVNASIGYKNNLKEVLRKEVLLTAIVVSGVFCIYSCKKEEDASWSQVIARGVMHAGLSTGAALLLRPTSLVQQLCERVSCWIGQRFGKDAEKPADLAGMGALSLACNFVAAPIFLSWRSAPPTLPTSGTSVPSTPSDASPVDKSTESIVQIEAPSTSTPLSKTGAEHHLRVFRQGANVSNKWCVIL